MADRLGPLMAVRIMEMSLIRRAVIERFHYSFRVCRRLVCPLLGSKIRKNIQCMCLMRI